jgi:hypothetical protein
MPYIEDQDLRKTLKDNAALVADICDPGALNFFITVLLLAYVKKTGKKYLTLCVVMGTLICVAFEFYRRFVSPYEDEKIKENGDVYV